MPQPVQPIANWGEMLINAFATGREQKRRKEQLELQKRQMDAEEKKLKAGERASADRSRALADLGWTPEEVTLGPKLGMQMRNKRLEREQAQADAMQKREGGVANWANTLLTGSNATEDNLRAAQRNLHRMAANKEISPELGAAYDPMFREDGSIDPEMVPETLARLQGTASGQGALTQQAEARDPLAKENALATIYAKRDAGEPLSPRESALIALNEKGLKSRKIDIHNQVNMGSKLDSTGARVQQGNYSVATDNLYQLEQIRALAPDGDYSKFLTINSKARQAGVSFGELFGDTAAGIARDITGLSQEDIDQYNDFVGYVKGIQIKEFKENFGASQTETEMRHAKQAILNTDMSPSRFSSTMDRLIKTNQRAKAIAEEVMASGDVKLGSEEAKRRFREIEARMIASERSESLGGAAGSVGGGIPANTSLPTKKDIKQSLSNMSPKAKRARYNRRIADIEAKDWTPEKKRAIEEALRKQYGY